MGSLKEKAVKFFGVKELTENSNIWKSIVAEFIGTMFLVLIGCGSCTPWSSTPDLVQISLAFGITVATMVQCICHVSGGHINPAVSLGMILTGNISMLRFLFYVLSQCTGAIAGAALLDAFTPKSLNSTLGMTTVAADIDIVQACGIELFITFVLVFTVFGVCDKNRSDVKGSLPLTIGLSVAVCHLFAISYTGSGMNPARSFGPAVVMNLWDNHWVYWVGPCLGSITAAILYQFVFRAPSQDEYSEQPSTTQECIKSPDV